MKRVILSILVSLSAILAMAQVSDQEVSQPRRTAEEIARKQTEMMVRELELTDSLQRDTLYRLHLRYVRMRMISNTRAEELERMQSFFSELKLILTKDQYDAFMNMQVEPGPRQQRERQHNGAKVYTPLPPRVSRPQGLPADRPDNARQDTSASSN